MKKPPNPRTRGRDSYEGMKVIAVILVVWTFGFLYLSGMGYLPYISGNQTYTSCCNLANLCLLAVVFALLLRFRKEERIKARITELLEKDGTVTVSQLAEEFVMNPTSVAKIMLDWAKENPGSGEYDSKTGCITKTSSE